MYLTAFALVLAFWFLNFALLAQAGIYVLKPASRSTCQAGKACTIEWLDDGVQPLLTAAGVCTFGLYHGNQKLVQALPPTDVSSSHSVTFEPIAAAGPNSDAYYIGITSTAFRDNSSTPYMAFSPFFRINNMTGSFDTPLPEATSSIPIPSSLAPSNSNSISISRSATQARSGTSSATSRFTTILSTITVGTLSTSLPPLPTPTNIKPVITQIPSFASSTQTRFTTSLFLPSPSSSESGSIGAFAPVSTAPSSNGAGGRVSPILAQAAKPLVLLILPLLLSFF